LLQTERCICKPSRNKDLLAVELRVGFNRSVAKVATLMWGWAYVIYEPQVGGLGVGLVTTSDYLLLYILPFSGRYMITLVNNPWTHSKMVNTYLTVLQCMLAG